LTVTLSNFEVAALAELLLCWVAWVLAFIRPRNQAKGQKKTETRSSSRVGIFVVTVGFFCAWVQVSPSQFHKSAPALITSMIVAPLAVVLAWWSTRHLGKQWRYVAALTQDHELITTGPYQLIRHPIYTSIFGMLLATVFAWSWWPLGIAAVVFYIIGTEIRIRAEDSLLAAHFGDQFAAWRAKTPAYIPFIR
jgi:protein-S-isoprenylcysteine O-methyltransferase Ste14